jgi:hypothetical protein
MFFIVMPYNPKHMRECGETRGQRYLKTLGRKEKRPVALYLYGYIWELGLF